MTLAALHDELHAMALMASRTDVAAIDVQLARDGLVKRCLTLRPRPEPERVYRHRKGGTYRELLRRPAPYSAREGDRIPVQVRGALHWAQVRGTITGQHVPVVIYQGEDGRVWLRAAAEFDDGRFQPC